MEFAVRQCDRLALCVIKDQAVEQKEDLVTFSVVGCPVDHEESTERRVNAEFFAYFAPACLGWCLTRFHVPARYVPVGLVRRAHDEHPVLVVEEEGAGRHTWCRHRGGRLRGHSDSVRVWSGDLKTPSEVGEHERWPAALLSDPREHELAAEVVVADLLGGEAFGVKQQG